MADPAAWLRHHRRRGRSTGSSRYGRPAPNAADTRSLYTVGNLADEQAKRGRSRRYRHRGAGSTNGDRRSVSTARRQGMIDRLDRPRRRLDGEHHGRPDLRRCTVPASRSRRVAPPAPPPGQASLSATSSSCRSCKIGGAASAVTDDQSPIASHLVPSSTPRRPDDLQRHRPRSTAARRSASGSPTTSPVDVGTSGTRHLTYLPRTAAADDRQLVHRPQPTGTDTVCHRRRRQHRPHSTDARSELAARRRQPW